MSITLTSNQLIAIAGGLISLGLVPAGLWAMGTDTDVEKLQLEHKYVQEDVIELKSAVKTTHEIIRENREAILILERDAKAIRMQNEEIGNDIKMLIQEIQNEEK
tara:strand:+ start:221 stop:535 length:315 start_codon:yes stop_codon:yes gene_type:complete